MNEHRMDDPSHEPDLNALAALAEGRRDDPERRRQLLSHLDQCRHCREILATAGKAVAPAVPTARRTLEWRWIGLAASVALAGIIGYRMAEHPREISANPESRPSPGRQESTPARGEEEPPAVAVSPVPARPQPRDAPATRRGGTRRIGSKTFRLVAGAWIDEAYDPTAMLPVREMDSPAAREEAVGEQPDLRAYLPLGDRFTVVLGGKVYRSER